MKPCYIGFDTSNYTTSCAVCDADGVVFANLKIPLDVAAGQRGLRQSEAVFSHVRNMPTLMARLSDAICGYTPIAVGVSVTPRDAEDSYMPCFLVGKSAAYAFAANGGLPVCEVSHQSGHIMAALYSAKKESLLYEDKPYLAFHVSGGTTEALLVRPKPGKLDACLVGGTSDINAGQAIDRVGVYMGLSFPCGRELEALAHLYEGKLVGHAVCVRDGVCSLSGVENIAKKIYDSTGDKSHAAAFVFDFIGATLHRMCAQLMDKYGRMPVIFAGGVMSNKIMRASLGADFEAYFAEPEFSADNAAGVALLCRQRELNK